MHLSGITFDFLWDYADVLRSWADRTDKELRRWRTTTPGGKAARARRIFRKKLQSG